MFFCSLSPYTNKPINIKGRFSQITAILVNMPLNKDCILIKMLYRLKRYTAQKSLNEFPINTWNERSFQGLLTVVQLIGVHRNVRIFGC